MFLTIYRLLLRLNKLPGNRLGIQPPIAFTQNVTFMTPTPSFRYPTQSLGDLELVEDVAVRSTGMTAAEVQAAYGSPHPKSAAHRLVWQEPGLARDGSLFIRRVYRSLPGAALAGSAVGVHTWGAQASVVACDVATGTAADSGMNVIQSAVEPKDAQTARKRTVSVEWPTLESQRLNARGDVETVAESKAAPGSALPAATLATAEIKLQAETADRATLTVAQVASHAALVDKASGGAALVPARLRAREVYETTDSLVVPSTAPDALSTTVLESVVKGKTRNQSVKRTTVRTGTALPSVTDFKLGPQGEVMQTTEALVAVGAVPSGAFGVISDAVHDTGAGVAVRTTEQLASGETFPALTGAGYDAGSHTTFTTTRQIVPAGTAMSAAPLIFEQSVQPVDKWRSIHIVSALDSLPASYQENRHLRFRFPGLFYSYTPTDSGIVSYRHAMSRVVSARVAISFSYVKIETALLDLQPVSWSYPLRFSVSNVLTNGEHFDYTGPKGAAVSVNVPASSPTRADYEALIGTYAVVAAASVRWKGGVWRTEVWQVVLE